MFVQTPGSSQTACSVKSSEVIRPRFGQKKESNPLWGTLQLQGRIGFNCTFKLKTESMPPETPQAPFRRWDFSQKRQKIERLGDLILGECGDQWPTSISISKLSHASGSHCTFPSPSLPLSSEELRQRTCKEPTAPAHGTNTGSVSVRSWCYSPDCPSQGHSKISRWKA